jgi:hypothetical protein
MKTYGWRRVVFATVVAAAFVAGAPGQESGKDSTKSDAPTKPKEKTAGTAADPHDARTPKQPTAEDVIKAFERDRPVNKPVRPRGGGWSPSGSSPGHGDHHAAMLRDGAYVKDWAGRISADGPWWVATFESDTPDSPRPPMRVLPNQQLERMVREQEASPDSIVFVMSGEATLFQSGNYLLVRQALRRVRMGNLDK